VGYIKKYEYISESEGMFNRVIELDVSRCAVTVAYRIRLALVAHFFQVICISCFSLYFEDRKI
jgi:hypothetical protein